MPEKRIFISYAREDGEDLAQRIYYDLLANEFDKEELFLDRNELTALTPRSWWTQIRDVLATVDYVVLIATNAALNSENVRKEWREARSQGAAIMPIQFEEHDVDFDALPRYLRDPHYYTYEHELDKFLNDLNTVVDRRRATNTAPALLESDVPRPIWQNQIIDLIIKPDRSDTDAKNIAVVGTPDVGKRTIVRHVCHDEDINLVYDDGVLWVTLGKEPSLEHKMRELYREITNENPEFPTMENLSNALIDKLEGLDYIIVLDEVYSYEALQPFLLGGERCTRIIITEDNNIVTRAHILPEHIVNIPTLQEEHDVAYEIITYQVDESTIEEKHRDIFNDLIARLDYYPLLLQLLNGQLRARLRHYTQQDTALDKTLDFLSSRISKGVYRESVQEFTTLIIENAVKRLDKGEAYHHKASLLSVFPYDTDVPLKTVASVWGLDEAETDEFLFILFEQFLIKFNLETNGIRTSKTISQALRSMLNDSEYQQAHDRLIREWDNGRNLQNDYAWRQLFFHLHEADLTAIIYELLQDVEFIAEKILETDIYLLRQDFVVAMKVFKEEEDISKYQALYLMHEALRLSSSVISEDPSQLSGQLHGRLIGYRNQNTEISNLLTSIESREIPFVYTIQQAMQPAGGSLIKQFTDHRNIARDVTIEKDRIASASEDGTLNVWNWRKDALELTLKEPQSNKIRAVVLRWPYIFSSGDDDKHTIYVWEGDQLKHSMIGHSKPVRAFAVDGDILLSASYDGTVAIWNWREGKNVDVFTQHESAVRDVTTHGNMAISGDRNGMVLLWDWTNPDEKATKLSAHTMRVNSVATDGQFIASGGDDKEIIIWNMSGTQMNSLPLLTTSISALSFNDHYLIAATRTNLRIWRRRDVLVESRLARAFDTSEFAQVEVLPQHSPVKSLATEKDIVVTGSVDGSVRMWDVQLGNPIRPVVHHQKQPISSVAVVDDIIFTGGADGYIKKWDWDSHMFPISYEPREAVTCLDIGDRMLAAGLLTGTIRIWNWQNDHEYNQVRLHSKKVNDICYYDDFLLSVSEDSRLSVADRLTGGEKWQLSPFKHDLPKAVAAWNNKILVAADHIRLFDINNAKYLGSLYPAHDDMISRIAVYHKIAITASLDCTLSVWNLQNNTHERTFSGHTDGVNDVIIVGGIAISCSSDRTIRFWRWSTGKTVYTHYTDHKLRSLAISPDKKMLVVSGDSRSVYFLKLNDILQQIIKQ